MFTGLMYVPLHIWDQPAGRRNDDRNGENQDVIGTGSDVHTVGVGDMKPLLRDFRHPIAALVDLILVTQDLALCFHVLRACYVNVEALAQRRDQGFLDLASTLPLRYMLYVSLICMTFS